MNKALILFAGIVLAACTTTRTGRAVTVLSRTGPLPVRSDFETNSPAQTAFIAASAYAPEAEVRLEVQVLVDGSLVGRCRLYSNGPDEHRALVCPAIALQLAPGRHTLELRAGNDETATDPEDVFEVTLIDR